MNATDPIPPDQVERCVKELRKVSVLIDEIERGIAVSKGLHAVEARRCISLAGGRLQEAGYWIGQAVKHATEAANE